MKSISLFNFPRAWRVAAIAAWGVFAGPLLWADEPHIADEAMAKPAGGTPVVASEIPSAKDLARPEWIDGGRARFIQTCAYCHGREGEAGKTPPFRSHANWDPKDIFETISNGRKRGGNVMPTWKDAIPPEDIWKIVAYIKFLAADADKAAAKESGG
jgi:mono/diheme cytochrome c family protein